MGPKVGETLEGRNEKVCRQRMRKGIARRVQLEEHGRGLCHAGYTKRANDDDVECA